MIQDVILIIETVFIPYGAVGVFAAAFLEEVIVPIPSAFIMMASGFLFLGGNGLSMATAAKLFYMVALPASLGMTVGSLFVYFLTYAAGKPIITRWGKFLWISWEDVEKAEQKFTKGHYDGLTLFSVRAIPLIPSVVISAFCGLTRLKIKKYVLFTFLGTLVRASLLGFLGWQAGNIYVVYAEYLEKIEKIVLLCIVVGILAFLFYRIYKNKLLHPRV